MTPTEVLKEIYKMPVAEERLVLRELAEQLDAPPPSNGTAKRNFDSSMQ